MLSMTKKKNDKKPRRRYVEFSTTHETKDVVIGIASDASEIRFATEMSDAHAVTGYEREKGGFKVLNKIPGISDSISIGPERALSKFDYLLAVDTNTKDIEGRPLSITGIVKACHDSGNDMGVSIAPRVVALIEFRPTRREDAERLGWILALKLLVERSEIKLDDKIGMIVDHDMNAHSEINSRNQPVYGNEYLPGSVYLVYAYDRGEFTANRLIRIADKASNTLFDEFRDCGLAPARDEFACHPYLSLRHFVLVESE